ncbi:MAG: transcription-repair coupling factor [Ruminococcus sp.]|nr:transcription-repair coupling factor [Ruminococcus sp.]
MNIFDKILEKNSFYSDLYSTLTGGYTPISVTGVSGIHKAHIVSGLCKDTTVLMILADESAAVKAAYDINTFSGTELACVFPEKELVFAEMEGASREYERGRINALSKVLSGRCRVICASITAAIEATIPPDVLEKYSFDIAVGDEINTQELISKLTASGYTRCDMVEGQAQFSVRGSVIDIFPVSEKDPIRIELWGDEIDSAGYFDTASQRRTESIDKITVFPALEIIFESNEVLSEKISAISSRVRGANADKIRTHLLRDKEYCDGGLILSNLDKYYKLAYDKPAYLFDYFDNGICVFCEYTSGIENLKSYLAQSHEDIKLMYESGIMFKALDFTMLDAEGLTSLALKKPCVFLDTFMRQNGNIRFKKLINTDCRQTSGWGGSMLALDEQLKEYTDSGYTVILFAGSEKTLPIIVNDLKQDGFDAEQIDNPNSDNLALEKGQIYVMTGSLSAGVDYPEAGCAIITQMKAMSAKRKKPRHKKGEEINSLSDLSPGDYVVHAMHGIGKYAGIKSIETSGVKKDYITIKYAGTDVLYVPVTQLDLVSRYVSAGEESNVKLHKLGSTEWQRTRNRVRNAVKDMAEELTTLYAQRQQAKGYAFSPDNDWQADFEERFDYTETDDQIRCVQEIKDDMMKPVPMDRLLCGDVGFGKTEVALRAAFKCVLDSKQVAILVPTTVLAWQHYQTAIKRFEHFPIKVDLLSRFRNASQQQATIRELKRGTVDIVIGTHRLVQKDVGFKDLGLVIVDEEQRFGVAAKEKLKEMFNGVDVLTLSATPIPRTLNMALSGIRDMSVIEEPPQDRQPVQSYVIEHDLGIIAQAINKELRRGGQVYYIHNRIDTIYATAEKLSQLLPNARIGVAHGKIGEQELSDIWRQLIEGEIDVLVCTTLIETGVDVANVNTLIIEDADKLGLSQLYQLRGRVGRSSRRAYAYFTFRRGKVLSEVAARRLETIKEFTKFGSGFHIAMRDLEIRGAGSILSGQQHGHMEAVGYDLYLQMLNEAIAEQKGETPPPSPEDCMIDITIDAYIPHNYIESDMLRIDAYRKIASIVTEEDSRDVIDEFIDRYGEPPKPVMGLINVALIRNMAAALGIREITQKGAQVVFYMKDSKPDFVPKLLSKYSTRLKFIQGEKSGFSITPNQKQTTADLVNDVIELLK